ncbi:amidohydrolase family protein [Neolewinella lacunae]|uniref:Amidohydrolase family protein n=1 Tax=Neolewinella lacunae TaxID=1517758 RepID=A0A923PPC7_9BACT|nr:amidohydrolase family protein [Neolewinella lacunae]MBC6995341.1 amidohydrolase family protein [Neolewinella lacunae]MDN3633053.1 amidohydrolase family protein [Neolewinella lacunae]
MRKYLLCFFVLFLGTCVSAQVRKAPDRGDVGDGPHPQLILRGLTLINGNCAPPIGPVDIVIEGNKIVSTSTVGVPDMEINPNGRPKLKAGGKEIDCAGMYVLPGFVDMHGHIGGRAQGADADYVFKLWLSHGITTIREPGSFNGLDWVLDHKKRSASNAIAAPRIVAYTGFGMGREEPFTTTEQVREWVRANKAKGSDGIKFFGARPDLMQAALETNKEIGLGSACHHAQMDVGRWNVLKSARAGLTSMEHWYGLPEALFNDRTVQDYPVDYNYQNEQDRFGEAGRLWEQAAAPYSDHWNAVMNELLDLDFTINPTFNIYDANRDVMRARNADWHAEYTLPSLWKFYQPSRVSHGSYWHQWGTEQEVNWKKNYQLWMTFINEYKNRGGRVTAGSDSGFIYQLYGFGYIRELELLREAGFHPLEVIRSATLYGAEALGMEDLIGTIEPGKLADLVIVGENPLADLKVLYGTGATRLDEAGEVTTTKGIIYTVKDGIVYDAVALRAAVREMVKEAKRP